MHSFTHIFTYLQTLKHFFSQIKILCRCHLKVLNLLPHWRKQPFKIVICVRRNDKKKLSEASTVY